MVASYTEAKSYSLDPMRRSVDLATSVEIGFLVCSGAQILLFLRVVQLRLGKIPDALLWYLGFEILQVLAFSLAPGIFAGVAGNQRVLGLRLVSSVVALFVTRELFRGGLDGFKALRDLVFWLPRAALPVVAILGALTFLLELVGQDMGPWAQTVTWERSIYTVNLLLMLLLVTLTSWFRLPLAPNLRLAILCWFGVLWAQQFQIVGWWLQGGSAAGFNLASAWVGAVAYGYWAWRISASGEEIPFRAAQAEQAADLLRQLREANKRLKLTGTGGSDEL